LPELKKAFCNQESERRGLAAGLRKFYDTTRDYVVFQSPSQHDQSWEFLIQEARERIRRDGEKRVRILEVGAGRSGLARYLSAQNLREKVYLHAQDVTLANQSWLKEEFNEVTIGDLKEVKGTFDLVISTYVFEHTVDPAGFLGAMWERTVPGGVIYLFCPRYDLPFYLPRAADHLGLARKIVIGLYVQWRRLLTRITSRPAWLVQKDPAVFHLPFFRDRDAVHWVSWWDIRARFPQARVLSWKANGWREWLRLKCLTVNCKVGRGFNSER
jgi:SAM-dependent methyltransferase